MKTNKYKLQSEPNTLFASSIVHVLIWFIIRWSIVNENAVLTLPFIIWRFAYPPAGLLLA
ncbi:unnamed protein product [Nezara viridula]|uniref:Uncharacterized protein n=1 Tax=Nezara viridula TaxID=85310 RepID=A0A9P0E5R1_NEZVI|nr:unnamed protein product [Nezara viridula]